MEEPSSNHQDEATEAVLAYLAASEIALGSAQHLNEAWRKHFKDGAEPPPPDLIAQVAQQLMASDLALGRARIAKDTADHAKPAVDHGAGSVEQSSLRIKRRRQRENKFLANIGKPGQRFVRSVVLVLLVLSVLVATGAGISLALEVAGFLHLIDDPVQLPFAIQLAIFVPAVAAAFGLKRALKPVERALYGSKGVRPKGFTL